ncbi:MAG: putative PEP-binding protein, partial [Planctomycetota bacterium]
GVRGLVAGANHGSYTSLMMRQCLTCLSNHHSAPHAKWIGYLFTGTKIRQQIEAGTPVQDAINRVTDECSAVFARSANALVREKVEDLEDLTRRLLKNLENRGRAGVDTDYHGRILIAPRLFPSDILRFVAQKAEGIILTSGGVTAHISVLARSLEMPMILADAALLADVATGATILMDAHTGAIYINPDVAVVASYASLLETHGKALPDAGVIEPQTHTRDGRRIRLMAAIGLISEAKLAHELRAEGIGLYRSELPFLIRNSLPSEDEQYAVYRKIMKEMEEGDIVFRALDIGGDKILRYYPAEEESNPSLGLRGVRFTFHHREVFSAQVRALLRAGHDRPLKIMFPLVSSVDSFAHAGTWRIAISTTTRARPMITSPWGRGRRTGRNCFMRCGPLRRRRSLWRRATIWSRTRPA